MEDQDVGTRARKLSDGAGDSSLKMRINAFFMNEAYGSLFLNMIADVAVRCMYAILLPLLGCCLAFGCCRKAKRRKDEFSKRQLQQLNDIFEERGRVFWLTEIPTLLEANHRLSASDSENSASTSDRGLENHGSEATSRDDHDDSTVSELVSQTPKLNGYVDQIQTVEKRPVKPDVRKRLNVLTKHLPTDSEGRFVKHGSGEATTLSSEKPSVEPQASSSVGEGTSTSGAQYEHILDIPVLAALPSSATLESGDALKGLFKLKLAIKFIKDMYSSRILEAKVKPTEENLRALRDLAVEGMKIDREFTLQIDRFFMYYCKGEFLESIHCDAVLKKSEAAY